MSVAYQGWGDVSPGPAMGCKQYVEHQYGGDTGFKRQQQQDGIALKLSALSIYMSCQNQPGLAHAYQLHQQQPSTLVRDCSADVRATCLTATSPNLVSSTPASTASHLTFQSRLGPSPSKETATRDLHSSPHCPSTSADTLAESETERTRVAGRGFLPSMAAKPRPVPVRPQGVTLGDSGRQQESIPHLPVRMARPLMNEGADQSHFLLRRNMAGNVAEDDSLYVSSSDSESDNEDEKDEGNSPMTWAEECMDAEPCMRVSMFPARPQSLSCSPPSVLCVRKGLSRHYGGKSRSFTSLADAANCQAQDLAKPDYSRRRGMDKKMGRLERHRMGPLRTWESGISKRGGQGCGKSTLALGMTMITEGISPTASAGRPTASHRDFQHLLNNTAGTTDAESLMAALDSALNSSCSPARIHLSALQQAGNGILKPELRSRSFSDLQVVMEGGDLHGSS